MKPKLMSLALEIHDITEKFDIELLPVWKERSTAEIAIADKLGRGWNTNTDEYRIAGWQFDEIEYYYGKFDIDLFSSNWSARTSIFVTKEPTNHSFATDAFSISWHHEEVGRAWIHPPVLLLPRVLEKLLHENTNGILLFPHWEGCFEVSQIMPQIVSSDRLTILGFSYLYCDSPVWRTDATFRGYPSFPFVIVDVQPMTM